MFFRLKIQHVVFASVFLAFVLVNGNKIVDPDMWWHLKIGEYIWQNKTIPHTDFYSFTNVGHAWITHEWLAEVAFYLANRTGNFYGLFILNLGVLTAVFGLAGRLIYLRAEKDLTLTTVILVACIVFTSIFWVFRPHLIAYLYFISYLLILELFHRGKNYTWLLPPIMILWVNTHGSYIIGLVMILLHIAGGIIPLNLGKLIAEPWERRQLKKIFLILVIVIAAIFVNPNTYKLLYYPFFTINSGQIVDNIAEWSSPDFHIPVFKAFLGYFFVVFSVLIISKKAVKLRDLLYLGLFTYLAMFGARNIALFMFVSGPVLAEHAAGFLNPSRHQRQVYWLNWLVLTVVLGYALYSLPPQGTIGQHVNREEFPVQAVEFINRQGLRGTVFNEYDWGGYLIWSRFPENKVFVDGRTDIYEDRVLPDYIEILNLRPGGYRLLQKYNPDYILLKRDAALNQLLDAKGDWRLIYEDEVAKLYRRGKENRVHGLK
ncbi:MAG: hypothetical protein ACOY4Q_04925 [Bacillota bacterium]